jgi:hypothetical protein
MNINQETPASFPLWIMLTKHVILNILNVIQILAIFSYGYINISAEYFQFRKRECFNKRWTIWPVLWDYQLLKTFKEKGM